MANCGTCNEEHPDNFVQIIFRVNGIVFVLLEPECVLNSIVVTLNDLGQSWTRDSLMDAIKKGGTITVENWDGLVTATEFELSQIASKEADL